MATMSDIKPVADMTEEELNEEVQKLLRQKLPKNAVFSIQAWISVNEPERK